MKNIFKNSCKILVAISAASSFSEAAPKWKKIISSSSGGSIVNYVEIHQDTVWTVPAGVTKVNVTVIGAGGGGGGASSGGGGGGGSCIKSGSTVLVSANGGDGGAGNANGKSGTTTNATLTVTPGATLDVFVGGGGGGGHLNTGNSYYYGGSGGYGNCGNGGAGGVGQSGTGGAGGANKGGGGGGAYTASGTASTSSAGAPGMLFTSSASTCATNTGGAASTPGATNSCGPGGASGGIGGCTYGNPGLAINSQICGGVLNVVKEPGEGGHFGTVFIPSNSVYLGTGGGGGAVYIWW